jgi:hypothetical protein
MEVAIFFDKALCSQYMNQSFKGIYHLHLHGKKILPCYLLAHWFLAELIFNREN